MIGNWAVSVYIHCCFVLNCVPSCISQQFTSNNWFTRKFNVNINCTQYFFVTNELAGPIEITIMISDEWLCVIPELTKFVEWLVYMWIISYILFLLCSESHKSTWQKVYSKLCQPSMSLVGESIYAETYISISAWHTHMHTQLLINYSYHAHHLLKLHCTTVRKIDRLLITCMLYCEGSTSYITVATILCKPYFLLQCVECDYYSMQSSASGLQPQ